MDFGSAIKALKDGKKLAMGGMAREYSLNSNDPMSTAR